MEQNLRHDLEGSSRRRRSSILKAPRMSMRALGSDQDENQEETRTIGKRRSSRRVSFATTNNIHVFPKDSKADPVLAPIQNLTVGAGDGQYASVQCFDTTENHDFMGLDSMLTTTLPIHFALNKENFFAEPILPVDSVDRTMLHGENSGYMDMTCNQTLAIVTQDVFNPDIPPSMSTLTEPHKLSDHNPKTFGTIEKDVVRSDFDDFLVRLSEPRAQKSAASFPKENNAHFILENAASANTDKENLIPACMPEHAPPEVAHMDVTTVQHVKTGESEAFQHVPYPVYGNCASTNTASSPNDSDDMELTHNQTAAVNLKDMKSANHSGFCADRQKCQIVCDDSSEMIMTGVLDGYVHDLEQLPERSRADPFQRNISFVPMTEPNDNTRSRSQALILQRKYGLMNTKQRVSLTLPDSTTEECKRNMTLETPTIIYKDQSDLMELTCQVSAGISPNNLNDPASPQYSNVAIALKPLSVCPEVKNTDHCKRETSLSHMVDDMETTKVHSAWDDMEMTRCQTVESKNCDNYKQPDKSNLETSANKSMISEMELNRYSFCKRTSTGNGVVPTAQRFFLQDLSGCKEEQQGTVSDLPVIQDDMELTECKTLPLHAKACGLSSKPAVSQIQRCDSILQQLGPGLASQAVDDKCPVSVTVLDAGNLDVNLDRDRTTYNASGDANQRLSLNSSVEYVDTLKETCSMEITGAFTTPLKEKSCVAFNQDEMTREITKPVTVSANPVVSKDHSMPESEKSASSGRKRYAFESDVDALEIKHSSCVKSRRSCLAVLQARLQNITQNISEPDGLMAGSVTAPLPSYTPMSPEEKCSKRDDSVQPSKEPQHFEHKPNLPNEEATTPFNLKNSLMARLSVGGIVPKFPTRARSISPNQVEPKSPDGLQALQLQMCFSADLQSGYCEPDLVDEVLPEEDLSGSLVSYPSKHEQGVDVNTEAIESDLNGSYAEKEGNDATMKDSTKKLWDSDDVAPNAPTRVVKITEDSSSSTMKCEGISELTLRNSQLDSQIDGTLDDDFDFYKKFQEGSVTVDEFLTHFGVKFVIHRSRPSALPDNFQAAQTYTMEDLLRENYLHRPKQRVYEADCQNLVEMADGFKAQMANQDKSLSSINQTLLQDTCAFSKEQLQRFGAKLKERRVYFRKRSKALSHKMKENLYSELLNTAKEAEQSLMSKIKETAEMLQDLDGCISDLESELFKMNNIAVGDQHSFTSLKPDLKAKQEQLEALNSEVAAKEQQICQLELQAQSLETTWDKFQGETGELQCCLTNLTSLNEWQFSFGDDNGIVFNFLHGTLQLEVKQKKATDDAERDADISFKFLLSAERSEPSAVMIHKLLKENFTAKWMQTYSTSPNIPMLLHDVSVTVSRLRLLGEEIHRLKKWGGLRLGILHITCVDATVAVVFSSIRAFVKFELSLAVTPDYPFRPLRIHKFHNHIGDTRPEQISDIISSVRPARNYLTTVMKRIWSNLLG